MDSLKIDFNEKRILEVGAGIGDHTRFLLNKGPKKITSLDARIENINILREVFKDNEKVQTLLFDMDKPKALELKTEEYDICYCYGLLYHLKRPAHAIKFLSQRTIEILLLETCVSYERPYDINLVKEDKALYSQSYSGYGCRPGRTWIFDELKKSFPFTYIPKNQPNHEQFPIDWTMGTPQSRLTRAVFVGSKIPLLNDNLTPELLTTQRRIG